MVPEALPKTLRMKKLWQDSLQKLDEARRSADVLPPHIAQAAYFYCFQHAMFLAFKTLKAYLKTEGFIPLTPKQHLEMAHQAGWIDAQDEDAWWILLMGWLAIPELYEEEQGSALNRELIAQDFLLKKLYETLPEQK